MSRKLTEYKQNPIVDWYRDVLSQNPNTDTILNSVQMDTETWTIDKLAWYYNNNRISSLPPYLQRVLLDMVWGHKNSVA